MSAEGTVMPSLLAGLDEEWLGRSREEVLEPELPICDPHHHLWQHPKHTYLLPEFLADSGRHKVVSTVYAECGSFYRREGSAEMRPVGEAEFAASVGAASEGSDGRTRVAAAFIGYADLTLGAAVTPVLEALAEAGAGRLRGVRNSAAWDPNFVFASGHGQPVEGLYRDARLHEGLGILEAMGLTFDAWVYHTQLGDVVDLARRFPDQPIVLNHLGGPIGVGPYADRRDAVFAQWSTGIRDLAECPNVWVKLGGLGSKRAGFAWHDGADPPSSAELAEAWRPYVELCIEAFGVERCMFESNFPVDKASCTYTALWNAFKRIAAGASVAEKTALFRSTAERFYRIG